MMKKLCLLAIFVTPFITVASEYEYSINDNKVIITKYTGIGGDVSIPETLEGAPVVTIGKTAFYGNQNLISIALPSTVRNIGNQSFAHCRELTSVTVPEGVSKISDSMFYGCSGLTNITIPSSVRRIETDAFRGCDGLIEVTISEGVTSIGDKAFYGCSNIKNITIPPSVKRIDESAFYRCDNLQSVTFKDGLTHIGKRAFSACYDLTNITLSASVKNIEEWAFSGCDELISITIPKGVTSIGDRAFDGCTGITNFFVDANNAHYSSLDGVLFNKNQTTLIRYPMGKKEVQRTKPKGEPNVGNSEFSRVNMSTPDFVPIVEEYVLPRNVKSIGNYAFTECYLTDIIISSGVITIGRGAFYDCSSLSHISLPSGVKSIGASAFVNCSGLTRFVIPSSVTKIEERTFANCGQLKSITIPSEVTVIEKYAFAGCADLSDVTIPPGVTRIEERTFANCHQLNNITIPSGIALIGNQAFTDCPNLVTITIPPSVTRIGDRAFFKSPALVAVNFLGDPPVIGSNIFTGIHKDAAVYFIESEENWSDTFGGLPAHLVSASDADSLRTLVEEQTLAGKLVPVVVKVSAGLDALAEIVLTGNVLPKDVVNQCHGDFIAYFEILRTKNNAEDLTEFSNEDLADHIIKAMNMSVIDPDRHGGWPHYHPGRKKAFQIVKSKLGTDDRPAVMAAAIACAVACNDASYSKPIYVQLQKKNKAWANHLYFVMENSGQGYSSPGGPYNNATEFLSEDVP